MAAGRQSFRRKSAARIRHLVGFSALIMLAFCTIVIYQGAQGYRQALSDSENNAKRLIRILADHVELTFLGADLALRRAVERQYMNSMFGNNLSEYMQQNFRLWLHETPQIVAMALVDVQGNVQASAHKPLFENWLPPEVDAAKTAQLIGSLKEADDRFVFIGKLHFADNRSLIIMSRRYNLLSGEFGGIVMAAINPEYFIRFYESIAFGEQKYTGLTLADGTVLTSGPLSDAFNDVLIQNAARDSTKSIPDDTQLLTTSMNNAIKIVASRRLGNMPVLVHTVLDENDILSDWRLARTKDISFLALFTVFGSALSFFAIAMARQILRAEESEEAAILASQAKSEFLANMSHELRTPLNAIIGFSEMMNSGYFGPLTPKQRERVHDINLCGTHLLQLITDILEFSKGDAGKLELQEEKVSVEEIIHECERIMDGKIKSKHIQYASSVDPGIPELWCDKRKIRQVLLNLLSNAVKFTSEQGSIRTICMLDAQGQITITVSDTGIGIAEEDIPKALSVFGQVHRSRSHEGTGLGLPLCKMYVELHGGKLTLASKLGEGTTVRIVFPPYRTLHTRAA